MEQPRHILLAEDEGGFRFSASVALRAAGYRVTTARDWPEALERALDARARGNPVQILVTDQQMPGMTGMELVRALRDRGFDFPMVIVTGCAGFLAELSLHGTGIREVIEKPVPPQDLGRRGETSTPPPPPLPAPRRQPGADRAIERALKATNLILQAGGLSLVALDLADAPIHALRRIPMTTWLRLQKVLEGQQAAAVVTGTVPMSRSAGGVTLALARAGTRDKGQGARGSIESEVRLQRARLVPGMGAPVRLAATAMVA